MTNLTEQWKKKGDCPNDKLKAGYHYAVVFDKERIIEKKKDFLIPYCDGFCCQNYQYLAPVPSYDEWKAAQEQLHKEGIWYTEISHKKVLKENAQLKERNESLNNRDINLCRIANDIRDENFALKKLLKECKEVLSSQKMYGISTSKIWNVLVKINEALK